MKNIDDVIDKFARVGKQVTRRGTIAIHIQSDHYVDCGVFKSIHYSSIRPSYGCRVGMSRRNVISTCVNDG